VKRVRDVQWSGDRGEGSIFFFVDAETKAKVSGNLYVSYRARGKEILVSAKTSSLDDAKRELKRLVRNRDNAKEGKEVLVTPRRERVTVGDVLDANLARAREEGLSNVKGYEYMTEILRKLLGGVRALEFGAAHVRQYRERRANREGTKAGRKAGTTTIRRELEVLETAFRYAVKTEMLARLPYIEKPVVDNVRDKEIPLDRIREVLEHVEPADVRDFCEFIFLTAMRPKGIRALRWDWFDEKAWILKVPSEKGGNAREFSIEGSLRRVIARRLAARREDCPLIFHQAGEPLDERKVREVSFYNALKACGLPVGRDTGGFILYDLKASAVGAMLDAGLSDAEAMDFSGHKTASMLRRYRKKTAKRHGASVRKRDQYLEAKFAESGGAAAEKAPKNPSNSVN